ncbi:AraC family transcriptional regulator [Nocardioides sp.]|uniref:helix-turn-helix domain-containing protein n=1 Tax=Nocardioides sp. TaxID=35761 RepID=UPI00272091E6|nr:helix-turn-helix domain-containing protein [Nocardioides sp.]MDO9455125.1 helix-turn-helix domain-containing protein [Nocardioides sp.]
MSVPRVLAPYVASLAAYDVVGEPGVHIGMPSTSLTLVLPVGEPLDVGWGDEAGSRERFWANVSGLHPVPAAIHHGSRQRGVYLDLTVAGARALLGVPAAELAGELVEVGEVDPALRDLPDRLAEADVADVADESADATWEAMVVRALVEALARHDAPGPRAEVGRALARLTGGARVAEVADEVGFSRRHLGDLVRAEAGVSPQEWGRLARFERSHALVRTGVPLAGVAATCGYADQSHLTREWVALAGCSPTEWKRREGS